MFNKSFCVLLKKMKCIGNEMKNKQKKRIQKVVWLDRRLVVAGG